MNESQNSPTLSFEIHQEGKEVRKVDLAQGVIKIGKLASSHLHIEDDNVSRMHAVIEVTSPSDINIIDLGSTAGTLVNGKKVNKAPLNNGDEIKVGDTRLVISFAASETETAAAQPDAMPAAAPVQQPQTAAAGVPPAAAPPPGFPVQQQQAAPSPPLPGMAPPAGQAPAPGIPGITPPSQAAAPAVAPGQAGLQMDLNEVEDTSSHSVEVIAMWNGSVYNVKHYIPVVKEKELEHYYIGEDPSCDFYLPPEALNGNTKVALATNNIGGGATVTILPSSTGDVTTADGNRQSFEDIAQQGAFSTSSEISGGQSLSLPQGGRVKMDYGPMSFLVNSVATPKKPKVPIVIDWGSQMYTGFSFIAHAIILFLIYFVPPDPRSLSLDLLDQNNRFIKYLINPPEIQQEEIPEWLQKDKKDDEQGGKGKRHKGEEGQMGKKDSKKTDNMYGIKGPKDNPNPHMAREMQKQMAAQAGILQYLQNALAPTSPFGQDTALGADPENALGALMGNQIGENFGFGGLGLRGTGRGGGGTGEGTIGLGSLGTIGHGGGGGSGVGYGRGAGGLRGRRGRAPRIRSGSAMVKGALSREVIRRIVHRHINEVKFCYERQLAQRPDLAGRVSIKFIIAASGAVQMAAVAQSTIGNSAVENCIAQAVRRWTFPKPEGGGIVIVTYPFMLQAPEE